MPFCICVILFILFYFNVRVIRHAHRNDSIDVERRNAGDGCLSKWMTESM
jgi:hypothetical protein